MDTVAAMWRWPVKSMAGERVNAMRLDGRGVGGDRTHAVLYEHKGEWRRLTDFGERNVMIARRIAWSNDGQSIYASISDVDADIVLMAGLL